MTTQFKLVSLSIFLGFLLMRCQKNEVAIAPKVATTVASQITLTTAKLGGSILQKKNF